MEARRWPHGLRTLNPAALEDIIGKRENLGQVTKASARYKIDMRAVGIA